MNSPVFQQMVNCQKLSLASNKIERVMDVQLVGMKNLKILSIGNNPIRRLTLAAIADRLEELWASYCLNNQVENAHLYVKLHTLRMDHSRVGAWEHVQGLSAIPKLKSLTLEGTPLYEQY